VPKRPKKTAKRQSANFAAKRKVEHQVWLILSNGHSPQIRQNGELLVRMCRMRLRMRMRMPLANVGESGEYSVSGLANVGEFGESAQHGSANVGESGESARHGLANVGESGESAQHGSAQACMIR
jgi:hypothetical protein